MINKITKGNGTCLNKYLDKVGVYKGDNKLLIKFKSKEELQVLGLYPIIYDGFGGIATEMHNIFKSPKLDEYSTYVSPSYISIRKQNSLLGYSIRGIGLTLDGVKPRRTYEYPSTLFNIINKENSNLNKLLQEFK